jgi:hypothetical protein
VAAGASLKAASREVIAVRIIGLFLILSAVCFGVFVLVDYLLGARAEYLNAWSVVERLAGREPAADQSTIARAVGPTGELLIVTAICVTAGAVLTALWRLLRRR